MTDYPTSFDQADLLKCARGELFGPGNAQLPEPPMLMISRITDVSGDRGAHGKGHIAAEFDIDPEAWFFPCHFPGNPVMPGCLMLDGLWQLTGFNLGWRGWQGQGFALGTTGEVKFSGMVRPDTKQITYQIDFTRVIDRKLKLGVADGRVMADGDMVCEASGLRVGLAAPKAATA